MPITRVANAPRMQLNGSDNGLMEQAMPIGEQKLSNDSFLLYQTEDGKSRIEVRMQGETVWLTQKQMAALFSKDTDTIGLHIRNIYKEGELMPEGTTEETSVVQDEGGRQVRRNVNYYNLDVIISVGYRVKSHRGTQFRIWATQRLREYIIKGFAMDDERLKNPPGKGQKDYFDEQLERIRDIRSSERRFYQKVLDIYARNSNMSGIVSLPTVNRARSIGIFWTP